MAMERLEQKPLTSRVQEVAKRFIKEEEGFLILTRKVDQGIIIGGNIRVRVLGVERDRVKLGIDAPQEVSVLRQELWHEGEMDQKPFERKPKGNQDQNRQP